MLQTVGLPLMIKEFRGLEVILGTFSQIGKAFVSNRKLPIIMSLLLLSLTGFLARTVPLIFSCQRDLASVDPGQLSGWRISTTGPTVGKLIFLKVSIINKAIITHFMSAALVLNLVKAKLDMLTPPIVMFITPVMQVVEDGLMIPILMEME